MSRESEEQRPQDHVVLRERCYLLHKTKQKLKCLREYVAGKDMETCMDIYAEIEKLGVECDNHTQVLKNAYPELGICFIPCCDCGRVGGVLTQLPSGEYKHVNQQYCRRPSPKTVSHRAVITRTIRDSGRTVNIYETASGEIEGR